MLEQSQNWIFLAVVWQQGLYGFAWAMGGLFLPEIRRAALHWVAFCVLSALALALMIERPWLPPWLGIGGADVMILASAAAVRRGAETFFGLRPLDHEHALVLALFVGVLALVGVGPSSNPWRVPLLTLLLGLMLLRTVMRVHHPMRQEFGARVAWVVHTPALLTAGVCLGRSVWVLGQPLAQMNIDRQLHQAPGVALGMLLALAGVHLAFAGMLLARLSRRLVQLSRHDSLTGLLNRRAAFDALALEWQRARRIAQPLPLLMLDVDHFKRVNDRHGHATGDAALILLAQVLRDTLRETDIAARWGGEEFLVALPGSSLEAALGVAERLRTAVRARTLASAQGPVSLSVSIGVAETESTDNTWQGALERADVALYAAKQAGRDRVIRAAPLCKAFSAAA